MSRKVYDPSDGDVAKLVHVSSPLKTAGTILAYSSIVLGTLEGLSPHGARGFEKYVDYKREKRGIDDGWGGRMISNWILKGDYGKKLYRQYKNRLTKPDPHYRNGLYMHLGGDALALVSRKKKRWVVHRKRKR